MAVLGVIVGCILAFIASSIITTAAALPVYAATNGRNTTLQTRKPGNRILLRDCLSLDGRTADS